MQQTADQRGLAVIDVSDNDDADLRTVALFGAGAIEALGSILETAMFIGALI